MVLRSHDWWQKSFNNSNEPTTFTSTVGVQSSTKEISILRKYDTTLQTTG